MYKNILWLSVEDEFRSDSIFINTVQIGGDDVQAAEASCSSDIIISDHCKHLIGPIQDGAQKHALTRWIICFKPI